MSGTNNTKYGTGSLAKNTGNNNTGIGAYVANQNLGGSLNTAVGSNSAYYNTSGSYNSSLGAGSLCNNKTGSLNTAIGSSALEGPANQPVAGNENTAVGAQALFNNAGGFNTAIGSYAGRDADSSYNTYLGADTGMTNTCEYSTAIGYNAEITASNQIVLGGANDEGNYPSVLVPSNRIEYAAIPSSYTAETLIPKAYADTIASGLKPTLTCMCATTTAISSITTTTSIPSSIDGVNFNDRTTYPEGDYYILARYQDNKLSHPNNGVWVLNNSSVYKDPSGNNLPRFTRPPNGTPMCVGYDAKGAFSFIQRGATYGGKALVQINEPAIVGIGSGANELQYETLFQLSTEIGQGLNTSVLPSGEGLQINVDSSLNFINFLDSKVGENNATGTLALGTQSSSVIIGPTGGKSFMQGSVSLKTRSGSAIEIDASTESQIIWTGASDQAYIKYFERGNDWGALQISTGNNGASSDTTGNNEPIYFTQRDSALGTLCRMKISSGGVYVNPDMSNEPVAISGFTGSAPNYQLSVNCPINSTGTISGPRGVYTDLSANNFMVMANGDSRIAFRGTTNSGFLRYFETGATGAMQLGTQNLGREPIYFTQANNTTFCRMYIDASGIFVNPSSTPAGFTGGSSSYIFNVNGPIESTSTIKGPTGIFSSGVTGAAGSFTSLTVSSSVSAQSFNSTSDYRLKENVQEIKDNQLYSVDRLRPVEYDFSNGGGHDIGLLAHELQAEIPCLVKGDKDGEQMQSVNYIGLIGILVKEIQALKERVSVLEDGI